MKLRVSLFLTAVFGFCAPLAAQDADLYLDVPLNGSVGDGQSTFYRLSVPTSAHLVLTLQNHDGRSRHTMYIQRDVLPTADGTVRIFDSNMQQIPVRAPLHGAGRSTRGPHGELPLAADLGFGDCRTDIAGGTMDGGRSTAGAAELFHFC